MPIASKAFGYTLMEVLLVLVVLVVAAALVAPAVMQDGDRSQLEDATDKLAEMWGRARLDAVSSGQTLLFQGELGGSTARVQSPAGAMGIEPAEGQAVSPARELQLENVVFRAITIAEPAGSEAIEYGDSASGMAAAVVFRPDGATSDAEALLQHTSGMQLKVVLRGMTGAVRVEEVETQE